MTRGTGRSGRILSLSLCRPGPPTATVTLTARKSGDENSFICNTRPFRPRSPRGGGGGRAGRWCGSPRSQERLMRNLPVSPRRLFGAAALVALGVLLVHGGPGRADHK